MIPGFPKITLGMAGGRPEPHSAPIHTLKSYFPLSTSWKEIFCGFLASNKAASCFEFLSAFTFRNKTEFGVFFLSIRKCFCFMETQCPFWKKFSMVKKNTSPNTLWPCHASNYTGRKPADKYPSAGLEEEQPRGANRERGCSSSLLLLLSSPLCQVQLGSLSD